MDAKLVVVGGNAKPADIKLKLPVTIGRGRQATLVVPHPLVSRVHCEIFESKGQLIVRDLDSLNGTFVNNQRIDEAVLPPGELLTLGSITFRAVYVAGHSTARQSPDHSSTPSTTLPPDTGAARSADRQQGTQDAAAPTTQISGEEEARTEVSDVDPQELADQLRETERDPGNG